MKILSKAALIAAALSVSACSGLGGESGISSYSAIGVRRVQVGNGTLSVIPPRPYNRQRRDLSYYSVREVEEWTLNGPYLDAILFVTGLKNDRTLVYQRRTASQQVPKFRSNMTAPEIAGMVESLFRVRGGTIEFRTLGIQPRPFLGYNGFQFDYEHLDGDELWRKGRAVGAVIDGRLYLVLFDAARSHYYTTVLPDFEAIVASASLRRG
jgi:hypothetical protein